MEASCGPGARHLPSVCAAHREDSRLRGEPLHREISAGSFPRASSGSSKSAELLATLLPLPPPQPSLGPSRSVTRQSPLQTPQNPQPKPKLRMKRCVIRTHEQTKEADDTTRLGLRARQSPVFRTARGAGVLVCWAAGTAVGPDGTHVGWNRRMEPTSSSTAASSVLLRRRGHQQGPAAGFQTPDLLSLRF